MRPRETQTSWASKQATIGVQEQDGKCQLINDHGLHHHMTDTCRGQTLGEFDNQLAYNYKVVAQPFGDDLEASHCKGFDGVQNHAGGTQKEENHVDYVREIRTQKDDAHVKHHNGECQTEVRHNQSMANNMNNAQDVDGGVFGSEANDEDTYPWYSARVICHWIIERMERDGTMYWNVDDFGGRASYHEEGMKPPHEFANDGETRVDQFHQLREELVC